MTEYIEREALIKRIEASLAFPNLGTDGFFLLGCVTDLIAAIPTADVVEVVRCKDCKHLEVINSREVYAKCIMTDLEFKPFDIDTRKHFCSYGERRDKSI